VAPRIPMAMYSWSGSLISVCLGTKKPTITPLNLKAEAGAGVSVEWGRGCESR
jgi:hypothetical protein